jgi:hypothetical protein
MTPYAEATAQLALADAIHDGDDSCNANYYIPATECPFRDTDIEQAAEMMEALRKAGWVLVRDAAGTVEMGL